MLVKLNQAVTIVSLLHSMETIGSLNAKQMSSLQYIIIALQHDLLKHAKWLIWLFKFMAAHHKLSSQNMTEHLTPSSNSKYMSKHIPPTHIQICIRTRWIPRTHIFYHPEICSKEQDGHCDLLLEESKEKKVIVYLHWDTIWGDLLHIISKVIWQE